MRIVGLRQRESRYSVREIEMASRMGSVEKAVLYFG